ncbi:MAG: hypothetical protein FWE24_02205 [Defluviitaleaceae bacterium]|nr:hypothetical protein [Defluviitaleaceae bacterium]
MNIRGENKYALIVFALMLVLTGALVFVAFFLLPQLGSSMNIVISGVNNELVHVPRVSNIVRDYYGFEHTVEVDFTIAVDESIRRDLDIDSIHTGITQTMGSLDYDRINAVGGMDYIKTEIIRELGNHINHEDFRGLYIRNITRDDNPAIRALDAFNLARADEPPESSRRNNVSEFFRGLGWRN